MKNRILCLLTLCLTTAAGMPATARADDAEALAKLRDTTVSLVNLLVERGLITRAKGDELIRQANQTAAGGQANAAAIPSTIAPEAAPAAEASTVASAPPAEAPAVAETPLSPGTVRVPYVPELVKNQIRDEVKAEVLAQAKKERWGDPGAFPEWVRRWNWAGDARFRYEQDRFPNSSPPNAPVELLQLAGVNIANTTDTRNRLRIRARLGVTPKISDSVTAGIRVATGNSGGNSSPVSDNQTVGNYSTRFGIGLDRAYISYQPFTWASVTGGRFANPFFARTDLVWDPDVNLEGVVTTFSGTVGDDVGGVLIAGAFPIQAKEFERDSFPLANLRDKWLFGYQGGVYWKFAPQSDLKLAVGFFDYRHVEGRLDTNEFIGSTAQDFEAPGFRQQGNSVFDLHGIADAQNPGATPLFGLASKFRELEISSSLDLGSFAPTHVMLDIAYVKNIGFNRRDILSRTTTPDFVPNTLVGLEKHTTGYQAKLTVGRPNPSVRGDWQAFFGYRYLERDAVLDAFTDSDFRLGGTDAQGYFVGGRYTFARNSNVGLRWLSGKQIDGASLSFDGGQTSQGLPLAVDVLQLDFSTSF